MSPSKLRIGSLKPLIGHAENASTFTGLVKLIHSMKAGRMQEVHGLDVINKGIVLEDGFEILREEIPWPRTQKDQETVPRRGAIHSLAVGGVNAHLILEEPPLLPENKVDRNVFLFVFSEENEPRLRLLLEAYGRFLSRFEQNDPTDNELIRLEYTLQMGRDEHPYRLAAVASSIPELQSLVQAWLNEDPATGGLHCSHKKRNDGITEADPQRTKLNELARDWVEGKTIDWNSIRPSLSIQRLNLPGNPLEKHLCWHEGVGLDTVFFAPKWMMKGRNETPAERVDYERTIVFCDWHPSVSGALRVQLGADIECIALNDASLPVDRRFISYSSAVFEVVQRAIQSCLLNARNSAFVQVVVPDDIDSIQLLGIAGLLKTARKEHSRFFGQLIAMSSALVEETIAERLHENLLQPADILVRYVSDGRQVQVWEELPVKPPSGTPSESRIWRDGGVFLVTGGAGALGLIVAREIARRSRGSTIVLTGRSPVTTRIKTAADEIHALGARVIYERVDIASKSGVNSMVERILKECGALSGIVHCAGVVDDKSILKKTSAEFENVLRPKVSGLCNLDEATKSMSLDCFILFSSVAAVFGNPGQADYAAGNSFMNGFSVFRNHLVNLGQRKGQTIAINWPLWADGGMDADAASKAFLEGRYAILPLPTDDGLRAMECSVRSSVSEVCVLYGDAVTLLESVIGGRL